MSDQIAADTNCTSREPWPGKRLPRALVVLAGVVCTQVVLYGPSLVGSKILLPLDILQMRNAYLPMPSGEEFYPQNPVLTDEIMVLEPWRRFAVAQVRQGRLPLWNPHNYCGSPFLAANQSALFSPFRVLDYLFPGTWVIAWTQLLKSLVAAIGMYLFLRRAVGVGFWPATVIAWCFPISGFMILWRGYPLSAVVAWFPWMLLAAEATIRRPRGSGGIGLALATAAALVSGHSALATQVLLAVLAYALWMLVAARFTREQTLRHSLGAALSLAAAFVLGALLSAPQSLPTAEYLRSSYRVLQRTRGDLETPPRGLAALPQFVLPTIHGSERRGNIYLAPGFSNESAAAGYAGLLITLFLAPLGWYGPRHRRQMIFWSIAAVLAAAQVLNLPGLVELFGVFPFNTLRNNRFVFVTAFALLVMAAIGLDALWRGIERWRWSWSWLPVGAAAALALWCAWCVLDPPDAVARLRESGRHAPFVRTYVIGCVLAGLACMWLLAVARGALTDPWERVLVAALVVGEPLVMAYGVNPQCDPALDFPTLSILERLKSAPPGRTCGVLCLPASMNLIYGLDDIRGYDGADPTRYVELMDAYRAGHPQSPKSPVGAVSLVVPEPSPLLDMLNLRYEIHRGAPATSSSVMLAADDHYVIERTSALPRAFVPQRVELVSDSRARLQRLAAPDFDPRRVAFVEVPLELPTAAAGHAEVVEQNCNQLALRYQMQTAGCLVWSDLWYPGWRAFDGDRELPILRVNHALRGVVLPAGRGEVRMRYEPASFARGLKLAATAAFVLALWGLLAEIARRQKSAA